MNIVEKTIGPDEAQSILTEHTNYRKMNVGRVNLYCRLMRQGKWHVSEIRFDRSHKLLDGQHRLAALIKANTPQPFICIYGYPDDCHQWIDTGQTRTKAQVLAGQRDVKSATNIASLVCCIAGEFTHTSHLSNIDTVELYDKYGDLAKTLFAISTKSPFRSGVHGAAFGRAILVYPERKQDLLHGWHKLCNFLFDEPRMDGLRLYASWIARQPSSIYAGAMRKQVYLRCARAVLAFLRGESMGVLRSIKDDPFEEGATTNV